jgi:predicted NBD/HSP70 family sugar kinase
VTTLDDDRWIFALSIDDAVECCFHKLRRHGSKFFSTRKSSDTIYRKFTFPVNYAFDIQSELRAQILNFIRTDKRLLSSVVDQVTSIGVSVVGLADRRTFQLTSIARKTWGLPHSRPVIEFRALFKDIFPRVPTYPHNEYPRINIYNETTAKCILEWEAMESKDQVSSIFYAMFSEGVNGAFVANGEALYSGFHTELGHLWPRPHRLDLQFSSAQSGCRIHGACYEALASAQRIRKTWTNDKPFDPDKLPAEARDVISFYVAQMCLAGFLTVAPHRILIGGSIVTSSMLADIWGYFRYFNDGGKGEPYLTYESMDKHDFIRLASIPSSDAGLKAAVELARRVEQYDQKALVAESEFASPDKRVLH